MFGAFKSPLTESNIIAQKSQKQETIMSVQESTATALVRFTGLGILCLNQDPQRAEIAAIRDDTHILCIKIEKPVFHDDAENDLITYQPIATYENLPKDGVRVEIKASNPAIAGYELYQSGPFDRLDSADANDFRWILNLHTLHGTDNLARAAKQDCPLAKIYVHNGLLYTSKLDRQICFEKSEVDPGGSATKQELFGNVAETVGVKIEGDEVTLSVRVGDREDKHSLVRVAGLPYRITITNMGDSTNSVFSDLPDYYNYVVSSNGKQFSLSPVVEEEPAEGDSISQRDFCHPIVLDDPPSIDLL
jgi:hypothetical protein